ncbi:MAG: DUF58 domain-containing protein [Deltaproteobacteria bacterium]|nr:DUF58 domain-containing protein [Deltaproteobacteria bacterium]
MNNLVTTLPFGGRTSDSTDATSKDKRSFWQKQKQKVMRLVVTRDGRILIGITMATGFAALNTGNNLLFFGWGLLLASILISGVLSETTLRFVQLKLLHTFDGNRGTSTPVDVELKNSSQHIPAFGVDVAAVFSRIEGLGSAAEPSPEEEAHTLFQLKLSPTETRQEAAAFFASRRGVYELTKLTATTAYPFGLFMKTKSIFQVRREKVHIGPALVDVSRAKRALAHRLGGTPSQRAGYGEDFFSLRPYRDGDDLRKVAWRSSARTGRLTMKETEAFHTREVVLVVTLPSLPSRPPINEKRLRERIPLLGKRWRIRRETLHLQHPVTQAFSLYERRAEFTLAAAYSLALELLNEDHSVGVVVPGASLLPTRGPRQREAMRALFARTSIFAKEMLPLLTAKGAARVAVHTEGASPANEVDDVVIFDLPKNFSARSDKRSESQGAESQGARRQKGGAA